MGAEAPARAEALVGLGWPRLGPATALRLAEGLGEGLWEALPQAERLASVHGVGPASAKAWAQLAAQAPGLWGQLAQLEAWGVAPAWGVRWWRLGGPEAWARLREEPLLLAEWGPMGPEAQRLLAGWGHPPQGEAARALAWHQALLQAWEQGAFGLAEGGGPRQAKPSEDLVRAGLAHRRVGPEGQGVWHLRGAWALEGALVEALAERLRRPGEPRPGRGAAVAAALKAHPHLDGDQRGALEALLEAPLGLLVGGPGSGKTTALRALVAAWQGLGLQVALASPTGRAARRLAEAVGAEATTLHRLLGCDAAGLPAHGPSRPLPHEVVVVDEAGMLDLELAALLVAALAGPTQLILVGDPDQLPPVGPGQVFADLLACPQVPSHRLGGSHRQAKGGPLAAAAALWRAGRLPELPRPSGTGDLGAFFWPTEDPAAAARAIVAAIQRGLPERLGLPPEAIQVLAERHAGPLGTRALNAAIQAALGRPVGPGVLLAEGQRGGPGDRVMVRQNRHELGLANGDLGTLVAVGASWVEVAFPQGPLRLPSREAAHLLGLAYAISGHKAQGSGYPAVLVAYPPGRPPSKAWTYTAMTRAEALWVGVGDPLAWASSLDQAEAPGWTALAERLQAALA